MPLTEIQTRQEIIDSQLTKAGWGFSSRSLVEEFYIKSDSKVFEKLGHYASKGEFADYVLLDKDNKPLAIVEAKRTNRDELAGKRQAADYADNLKKQLYQRKGLDSVGQQRLDNLNDLVGLSSRWRSRLRHLVQATAKRFRDAKIEDLQLKLLEKADNVVFEKKNTSGAILREGFYRKMAEGYKPLLDELLVEIGDLDPVAATDQ